MTPEPKAPLAGATGSVVPITAPRLAQAIAKAIFRHGDIGLVSCQKLQFLVGTEEKVCGGFTEATLRYFLAARLLDWGCPAGDPPNSPASATGENKEGRNHE